MNCDQAFDALTSRRASQDEVLIEHLSACPRCRDMADVLSPALELLAPAALEETTAASGEYADRFDRPTTGRESLSESDWVDSAPWRHNVQSARRARRDGLKIVGSIALVALLTVAFASVGRETPSSGSLAPATAADCIRNSSEPMQPERAITACVSCHLQLTENRLAQSAVLKAEKTILSCVDCHMNRPAESPAVRMASAEIACLFRSTGG